MINPVQVQVVFHELHLCRLTAVDQEIMILNFDELRRGESSVSRNCSAGAKYGDVE